MERNKARAETWNREAQRHLGIVVGRESMQGPGEGSTGLHWWSSEGYFFIHALQSMAGGRGGRKSSGHDCCDVPR